MRSLGRLRCFALCFVIILAGCGAGAGYPADSGTSAGGATDTPPTAQIAPTQLSVAAPTAAPATAPTLAAVTEAPALAAATPAQPTLPAAGNFVVPSKAQLPPARNPLPNATYAAPNIEQEVRSFFELFYQARTLERGGSISADSLSRLVDAAYADYTLPLFEKDIEDAQQGKLLAVSFSDLNVTLDEWQPAADGQAGTALVSVTRTRKAVRSDSSEAPQTATYQFRLRREPAADAGVAWVATDFLNPATRRWVSEPAVTAEDRVASEIQTFFKEFYAARTLTPGGKLDIEKTTALTQLSYRDYTLPLLQRQQDEVAAGTLIAVAYTDLKVQVLSYDPTATNHGGIATVQVTRTSRVQRADGAQPPQTGTYQFRVHRHTDDAGRSYWLAVDFKQPEVGRWVSEIAGMSVPVPASGYG
jgi:hypothetical protein